MSPDKPGLTLTVQSGGGGGGVTWLPVLAAGLTVSSPGDVDAVVTGERCLQLLYWAVLTHWHRVTVLDHKTSTGITTAILYNTRFICSPPITAGSRARGPIRVRVWPVIKSAISGQRAVPAVWSVEECKVSSETVTLIRLLSPPIISSTSTHAPRQR